METLTWGRSDGGFFVFGRVVVQAVRAPEGMPRAGDDFGIVVTCSDLVLRQHPDLPFWIANRLNEAAGLDLVALPKRIAKLVK